MAVSVIVATLLATAAPADANTAHAASTAKTTASTATNTTNKAARHVVVRPVVSSAQLQLSSDIRRIWNAPFLRRGKTAVYIVDAKSGKELYGVHQDMGMNAASNVKLVATATALDVLGASWRYQTSVYGPTPDTLGVIKGNVYLYGDHDGSLTPQDIEDLAQRISERGIKRIEGNVLFGAGVRDAIAWPWTYIDIQGGATPAEPPTVSVYPPCDFVHVNVEAKTSWGRRAWASTKRPRTFVDADGRTHVEVTVTGAIRVRRKQKLKRWIPMRSQFTASVLRTALINRGIAVTGYATKMNFGDYVRTSVLNDDFLPVELSTHHSAPLSSLVAKTNKQSDNMLADMLTMTVGRKVYGGHAGLAKGAKAMTHWLAAHTAAAPNPVVLDTGSGLSYKTRISTRQIVGTLRSAAGYNHTTPGKHPALFRKSLAIAGTDGTLRRRFRRTNVRGRLHGKTGTLSSVIALSGFLHGPDNRILAFSIVTNGTRRHLRWGVRRSHDKMVHAMSRYLGTGTWVAGR